MLFPGSFPPFFVGWPERGNTYSRAEGAFKGPLQKVAHSHTRPILGHVVLGLTNHKKQLTRQNL
jgi:hypothetical protein